MESWGEVSRVVATASPASGEASKISTLMFDAQYNLLWCGDAAGHTRSFTPSSSTLGTPYSGVQLSQYTKFKTSGGDTEVIQFLNHSKGVLSLSRDSVNLNNRRGVSQLVVNSTTLDEPRFGGLSAMSFNASSSNEIVVAGDRLFKVDLAKPNQASALSHDGNVSHMSNASKLLVLGLSSGEVELFDPLSNQSVNTFHGHNGFLSDMDVQGNYILSCGNSTRVRRTTHVQTSSVVDPLVNIYDIRMMRPLAPIPFSPGASFAKFHAKLPNMIVIASPSGQIQFVDRYDQSKIYVYQADLKTYGGKNRSSALNNNIGNFVASGNGEYIAFSDDYNLHLWSLLGNTSTNFSNFPSNLEQPDQIAPFSQNNIGVDKMVPLSCVGMPYFKDLLLSNYGHDHYFTKELSKVPNSIDIDLLEAYGTLSYFPYDSAKYGHRNIYEGYKSVKDNFDSKQNLIPKFISEKTGDEHISYGDNEAFNYKSEDSSIPNCYSNLKIHYSRFGVDDFDFSFYNRTKYSGLENHLDNSYVNPLIQIYKYCSIFQNFVIKQSLKEWLPTDLDTVVNKGNESGSSLVTELGYLFDMMDKSVGKNCIITNFSKVLSTKQEANKQGLINEDECKSLNALDLRNIIIKLNRYLLDCCDSELREQYSTSLDNIMRCIYSIETRSNGCGIADRSYASSLYIDLTEIPYNRAKINGFNRSLTIVDSIEHSMQQFKTIPCQYCDKNYKHLLEIRRTLVKYPPILSINISLSVQDTTFIKEQNGWLSKEFFLLSENGRSFITAKEENGFNKYELFGYVCEINHGSELARGAHNLVTYIKIEEKWLLFNDFLVMQIPEEEVFDISPAWKKPVIALYQLSKPEKFEQFRKETFHQLSGLNDTILYRDHFMEGIREGMKKEYELLTRDEAPQVGSLLAIDAEFVVLNSEKVEIDCDGTRTLVKPRKISLARISAIRGKGKMRSTPFIDDYIVHTGYIDDYLTKFSGIQPGDLYPTESSKSLTTLQTAYRKLWLLLNLGCVFVGHGLQNDFRCINLHVPKSQIRDTAELFYLADFKRKLSLKFLAYILLKEKVQTGNHDSIEDALTALLLYEKYLQLTSTGEFNQALYRMYVEGQYLRYRVPDS
ncbi:Piso0_002217 [Millerozyma farinosa CBS 7064]|uniref:PAN2-PAN3 deadenylation complex catalytic subunit PAN2 n=1 Tax=Pichia sorbitophila (strain ATCC MYA-4447 / BCRC 22081 / CBS 7064 / NBRC 10061 / NRRL Y-12695) TaxID=559304 RepID=G8YC09_PICSO|nr:Piso0_002217 [Millerozyma farinosa CBS 7064]